MIALVTNDYQLHFFKNDIDASLYIEGYVKEPMMSHDDAVKSVEWYHYQNGQLVPFSDDEVFDQLYLEF